MNKSNDFRQGLGIAIRLGMEMVVATGLGAFMGYGVDYYFETSPWGIAVGVVLGGAAGMINVYWAAQAMTKEIEKTDQEKGNDKDEDPSN